VQLECNVPINLREAWDRLHLTTLHTLWCSWCRWVHDAEQFDAMKIIESIYARLSVIIPILGHQAILRDKLATMKHDAWVAKNEDLAMQLQASGSDTFSPTAHEDKFKYHWHKMAEYDEKNRVWVVKRDLDTSRIYRLQRHAATARKKRQRRMLQHQVLLAQAAKDPPWMPKYKLAQQQQNKTQNPTQPPLSSV
jgi:hypothetical protein